ncbi:Chaperone protein DnaK [Minicystis rosea]|nr:Chaperone protein DnaK [Minicystis rosea]
MALGPLYVGIDLGTTNSTAAVFDGEKVTLIRNAQGATLTPSVVRIDARGAVTVGGRARRFLESDPQNTRSEFKRLMGTAQSVEFLAAKAKKKPEELAAEVLKSLRADVKEHLGFVPSRAVISVPALFELPQSAATSEAARLAGFEKVELIQEPVASALAAGFRADESKGSWLVYDLGGGTFDVSLLETRDGLLRVVGHDGDNFLGGRDFDWALVDWVLAELERTEGVKIARSDEKHAAAVRKLKLAVEEAKIELTRAEETSITLPGAFEVDGNVVDVDMIVQRRTLEGLCAPLIDRSIEVVKRLLTAHGLTSAQLDRIVLVGGPTVMPSLRARVRDALGVRFGEGLDPMTLVAQGAAIYAATAGLDARVTTAAADEVGRRVWLQYPAMSSDLTPHVVGRLVDAGQGEEIKIRLSRNDGLWQSPEISVDAEGAFVVTVDLLPRRPNVFTVEATGQGGARIKLSPSTFTIVQGLTISDPPLSRTVGVARADDSVRVFFERGAPLPARRTFTLHTVESVAKGSAGCLLKIPIVQGELEQAHLCRLVGTLEIGGTAVKQSLPAGAPIEVTLELDRGGHLSARALVPALGQVFEQVAHLLVPDATPESLSATLEAMRARLRELRADAHRRDASRVIGKLTFVEVSLAEVENDIAAARGGDADAGQKARRTLLEIDGMLEEADADKRWPELDEEAREMVSWASVLITKWGTPSEQQLFNEATQAVEKARASRQPVELQRQLRVVRNLRVAAFYRDPRVWEKLFENAAAEADRCTDIVKAQALVRDGRKAVARNDMAALKPIVEALWELLPVSAQSRKLGYDSGVR